MMIRAAAEHPRADSAPKTTAKDQPNRNKRETERPNDKERKRPRKRSVKKSARRSRSLSRSKRRAKTPPRRASHTRKAMETGANPSQLGVC